MPEIVKINRMSYGPCAIGRLQSGKTVFVRGGVELVSMGSYGRGLPGGIDIRVPVYELVDNPNHMKEIVNIFKYKTQDDLWLPANLSEWKKKMIITRLLRSRYVGCSSDPTNTKRCRIAVIKIPKLLKYNPELKQRYEKLIDFLATSQKLERAMLTDRLKQSMLDEVKDIDIASAPIEEIENRLLEYGMLPSIYAYALGVPFQDIL